jgi:hypothetical protein
MTSIARLFNTTALVQRVTQGAADKYGQPAQTWGTHIAALRCRLEVIGGGDKNYPVQVTDATHYLYCATADITEKDRITSGGKSYTVRFVNQRPGGTSNHMELILREERT